MFEVASVLTNQLSVQTGVITGFEPEGPIMVQLDSADAPLRAHFLRTTNDDPPVLQIGDAVLVASDADSLRGYILGVIAPYAPSGNGEQSRQEESQSVIDVALPANAEKVRLKARKISIEAGEEIQLTCGGGTILIDKRGKIVVRGTEIVSRARGANKIKGASVAIN